MVARTPARYADVPITMSFSIWLITFRQKRRTAFEEMPVGIDFASGRCVANRIEMPAAGISILLATQRPDAKSIPTGISSNAVLRFCLKVMSQIENDMVMGTSAYRAGVRATMFTRADVGVGYLAGEGEDPTITRVALVDARTAEQVVSRARAARLTAGWLTAQAAGVDPEPDTSSESILD